MIKLNQPYTSILPGLGGPKYYNAIDTDSNINTSMEPAMTPINIDDVEREAIEKAEREAIEKAKKQREKWDRFYENIWFGFSMTLFIIFLVIVFLFVLYIFAIVIGILVIFLNSTFENTLVFLFGRATYNKNFPICSDTNYSANGCYTTTNTYCS